MADTKNQKCPKCQAPQPPEHRFCSACGAPQGPGANSGEALAAQDLFDIAKSLSSTFDLDDLLKRIGSAAERLTGGEASSILLLDDSKKNLVFRVATGERGQAVKKQLIPIGQGVAGWVAQNARTVMIADVASDERFTGQIDKASGFTTRSILAVPMLVGGEMVGVCEVLNKKTGTFGPADESVLLSLANLAALSIMNTRSAQDQRNFFAHTIELLITAIEGCEPRSKGHSVRVAHLACAMGRRMGVDGQDYRDLYYGALLHDVGMIALNDQHLVSHVSAGLTERTAERLHPLLGGELLKGINILKGVIPLVRHHNEHYDGTGYPDRLVGEAIPLGARILNLVESIEALRLSGIEGQALTAQVEQMAKNGSGSLFDPKVVEAYLTTVSELDILKVS